MVPLIIPPDTVDALNLLSSAECRGNCSVKVENPNVFANTKFSEEYTAGWHSLHRLMDKISLKHPTDIDEVLY